VVEDALAIDLDLSVASWVAVEAPQAIVLATGDLCGSPSWQAPPPDDGENLGRTLCCLYQTFLC
jgi:hypothetical protein